VYLPEERESRPCVFYSFASTVCELSREIEGISGSMKKCQGLCDSKVFPSFSKEAITCVMA
jgi:hypothetical protein